MIQLSSSTIWWVCSDAVISEVTAILFCYGYLFTDWNVLVVLQSDAIISMIQTGLEVGWYAIMALPWPAQKRTTTHFLRNTVSVCCRVNVSHNVYLIVWAGSVIVNPECARNGLSAGLCPDPLGKLTALPRPPCCIWGHDDDNDEIVYFSVRWKTWKLVLSTAPKTWDNTDKDSKNRRNAMDTKKTEGKLEGRGKGRKKGGREAREWKGTTCWHIFFPTSSRGYTF